MEQIDRIDTHVHVVPDGWRKWCERLGYDPPDGMPAIPKWTVESQLEIMDKTHVSKAFLSVSSPGTHLVHGCDRLAREITREANVEVSKICTSNPARLAFFASLPLPDVQGSLEEIDFALDNLGAAGFVVMTNTHGVYLGDALLNPVFNKLNARKAIVFMHPTQCHAKSQPEVEKPLPEYPTPMLEFFFDTVRAVTNLLLTGTTSRCPHIRFLVSHGGAALPPLIERLASFSKLITKTGEGMGSQDIKHLFRTQFYFDLAGFPFPDLIHGLLRITNESHLLYGSDYPFTPADAVEYLGKVMDEELPKLFDAHTIKAIYSDNAQTLLK